MRVHLHRTDVRLLCVCAPAAVPRSTWSPDTMLLRVPSIRVISMLADEDSRVSYLAKSVPETFEVAADNASNSSARRTAAFSNEVPVIRYFRVVCCAVLLINGIQFGCISEYRHVSAAA